MTSPVLTALAQSHINETARREADLARRVHRVIGPNPVTDGSIPAIFLGFCQQNGVPALPARPSTCALFCLQHQEFGADALVGVMAGVARAHLAAGVADPTSDWQVNAVLQRIVRCVPPRSWPKEKKLEFMRLPIDLQVWVAKRDEERDRAVRMAQQNASHWRKQLQAAGIEPDHNVRETSEPKTDNNKTDEKTDAKETSSASA
jgi:hypothetical protein